MNSAGCSVRAAVVCLAKVVGVARDSWLVAPSTTTLPKPILRWAAHQVDSAARVVAVKGLRNGGHPWLLGIHHGGKTIRAVLRIGDPADPQRLATEAAALALAQDRNLPAPRLFGIELEGAAGVPVLLMTALPGSSRIPKVVSTGRLHALGAAGAALQQVALTPRPELPLRVRPIADWDFAAGRRAGGSSALLEAAEARLHELPTPAGPTVLVHGDLCWCNTMWTGATVVGLVDWDCAGAGHPGVDLGSLRCDAAVLFGVAAADVVLEGWRQATGRVPEAVAYWDVVVASLATPADMTEWVPVMHGQGRGDLDAATLTARRDAFLRVALDRLDRG
jgi:aminoglycoside phosphotransferase (APT) family kinase protein